MKKVRVLIVEDSIVVRALLEHIIERDPRLEVAATAGSAEEALRILEHMTPDVIAMDIRLPGMDGLEATRRIMSFQPVPIVVVAASVDSQDRNLAVIEALRVGALSVLEKPVGVTHAEYETLAERLCDQLFTMSQVKLVRRRQARAPRVLTAMGACRHGSGGYAMLGIACSTGGPAALVHLLNALGAGFPLPILLVQHMIPNFLPGFAAWLGGVSPFAATLVAHGSLPLPGVVHMAPPEQHIRLQGARLWLDTAEPVCSQRPSGTVLLQSMAQHLGPRALGIVLTGMGEDGAAGLCDMRAAGGYTIAEHASTAVVYGMPGTAVRLGGACECLPLSAIAPRVLELAARSAEAA